VPRHRGGHRAGATTVNLPDTVGYATPDETREFFADIIARVPERRRAVFSAHCHDDLGLAVANSLARDSGRRAAGRVHDQRHRRARRQRVARGVRDGAARAPGPAALRHRHQSPALYETSQLLATLTSEPVQANKAIVGRNAFAHEAGIHQDGVLKDARTYEIMRPEDVGQSVRRARARPPLGPPRRAARCETLGFTLTHASSTWSTAP
jgi:2-isopropylmalate synthase